VLAGTPEEGTAPRSAVPGQFPEMGQQHLCMVTNHQVSESLAIPGAQNRMPQYCRLPFASNAVTKCGSRAFACRWLDWCGNAFRQEGSVGDTRVRRRSFPVRELLDWPFAHWFFDERARKL